MAEVPTGVNFHPTISTDIKHILKRRTITPQTQAGNKAILTSIGNLVKSKFGAAYPVIDVSAASYLGQSINDWPLELAIIDKKSDERFGNELGMQDLPELYQPSPTSLIEALKVNGYHTEQDSYPSSVYDSLVTPLRITKNNATFILHPPSPFRNHMDRLFKRYCRIFPLLQPLVSLLYLWLSSNGLADSFSPHCLMVMTIGYLQSQQSLPSLQKAQELKIAQERGVWWTLKQLTPTKGEKASVVWCDLRTDDSTKPPDAPDITIEELLINWLKFWIKKEEKFDPRTKALAIRDGTGTITRRTQGVSNNLFELADVGSLKSPTIRSHKHVFLSTYQPSFWKTAFIVVQDPFLLTHNHAQLITRSQYDKFIYSCSNGLRRLQAGIPLKEAIFGDDLNPLRRVSNAPPSLSPSLLNSLEAMYENSKPSIAVLKYRQLTIQKVEQVIRQKFGARFTVECFGSTRYGVDSGTSDLDMVILDPERPDGFSPTVSSNKLPVIYNMQKVADALRQSGFEIRIRVLNATVPIVKFHDPRTDIQVDINCNERLGLINTLLLKTYCDLYPDLPLLIYFIKKWAKSLGLNDPSGANGPMTFSSYCLSLMTVGFLQYLGVLPNLQRSTVGDPTAAQFWAHASKKSTVCCDTRYDDGKNWEGSAIKLEAALHGWFNYWGWEHDYERNILSIRNGGISPRMERYSPTPKTTRKKFTKKKGGDTLNTPASEEQVHIEVVDVPPPRNSQKAANDLKAAKAKVEADREEELVLEDALAEQENLNGHITEPQSWQESLLVVADPFIEIKNCASACRPPVIGRFQEECQRAAMYLEEGEPLSSLLGDGASLREHGFQSIKGRFEGNPKSRDKGKKVLKKNNSEGPPKRQDKGKGRLVETDANAESSQTTAPLPKPAPVPIPAPTPTSTAQTAAGASLPEQGPHRKSNGKFSRGSNKKYKPRPNREETGQPSVKTESPINGRETAPIVPTTQPAPVAERSPPPPRQTVGQSRIFGNAIATAGDSRGFGSKRV